MPMRRRLLKTLLVLALVAAPAAQAQDYDDAEPDYDESNRGYDDEPEREYDEPERDYDSARDRDEPPARRAEPEPEPEYEERRRRSDEPEPGGRPGTYMTNREANLYSRPSADSRILKRIPPQTLIEVVSASEQWYEVRSRKGNPSGFIRRSYAEPFTGGRRGGLVFRKGMFRLSDPVVVRENPDIDSARITTIPAGTEVLVVGRSGNWYRIESEGGGRPPGYIPTISAKRVRDVE
ncbi:MAG: SH3 domain-containing protein [Candidatus Binatia bacterium]